MDLNPGHSVRNIFAMMSSISGAFVQPVAMLKQIIQYYSVFQIRGIETITILPPIWTGSAHE